MVVVECNLHFYQRVGIISRGLKLNINIIFTIKSRNVSKINFAEGVEVPNQQKKRYCIGHLSKILEDFLYNKAHGII